MNKRQLSVQTSHWHSNDGTHGMRLHVEDRVSGAVLLSLSLTPEQAYNLMRGSTQTLTGEHGRLDQVGKQMVHEGITYDHKAFEGLGYSDRDGRLERAVELAKTDLPGWESYEPRHTNAAGVTVIVRKWVEVPEETAVCNACDWKGAEDELAEGQTCPKCGLDEVHFFTPGGVA